MNNRDGGLAAADDEWVVTGRAGVRRELSARWFTRGVFRGSFRPGSGTVIVDLYIRFAGELEFASLRVDFARRRVGLVEAHNGVEAIRAGVPLPEIGRDQPIEFTIEHADNHAAIRLHGKAGLEFSAGLALREGRVGIRSEGDLLDCSLTAAGEEPPPSRINAFRCHLALDERHRGEPFWEYLNEAAEDLERTHPIAFQSLAELEAARESLLKRLRQSVGLEPWPERCPLNVRSTGTVIQSGFRIEKLVFDSWPDFPVTALLYVPTEAALPAPGIVCPIGHYGRDGLFVPSEQARAIGLAERGYVVLTYDPISQGERSWLGDGSHVRLQRTILMTGMDVSGLMFWDSIRAIDLLSARPEVDPERIGMTGISGGGFNTLFTSLLDPRVRALAPAGFSTTLSALIRRGHSGCCAYLPGMIADMQLDIADAYALLAPRPLLLLGGVMDSLSDRILEIAAHCRSVWRLFGHEEGAAYFVDPDAGHVYSKPMRLQAYAWFERWLKAPDRRVPIAESLPPERLIVSRESRVLAIRGDAPLGRDVVDLARDRVGSRTASSPQSPRLWDRRRKDAMKALMSLIPLPRVAAPEVVSEQVADGGRHVELRAESGLTTRVTIVRPPGQPTALAFYLRLGGGEPPTAWAPHEPISARLSGRDALVVPGLRADGQQMPSDYASVQLYLMALGRPLFAGRVADLARSLTYALDQRGMEGLPVHVYAEGVREGAMALCWWALDRRIAALTVSRGLVSYADALTQDSDLDFDWYVPGILRFADLPEIAALGSPRQLTLRQLVVGNGEPCPPVLAERRYAPVAAVFAHYGVGLANRFRLETGAGTTTHATTGGL